MPPPPDPIFTPAPLLPPADVVPDLPAFVGAVGLFLLAVFIISLAVILEAFLISALWQLVQLCIPRRVAEHRMELANARHEALRKTVPSKMLATYWSLDPRDRSWLAEQSALAGVPINPDRKTGRGE
jgi:hypothetical protein